MEKKQEVRRSRIGRVIADNTAQTIKVQIEGLVKHPRVHKYVKRNQTIVAHDPAEAAGLGDLVKIEESRPFSKTKRWILREVIEKATGKVKDLVKEATDDSSRIDA